MIFLNLETACVAENILRLINTMASNWHKNMLGYLSLGIICSAHILNLESKPLRSRGGTIQAIQHIGIYDHGLAPALAKRNTV